MGTSPQFGWPYPEPSAPVRDGADAMKAMATAMDLSFRGGLLNQVTDANGAMIVANHGLGRQPKLAGVTAMETGNGPVDAIGWPKINILNSSGLIIVVWRGDGSGRLTANGFTVYWWVMG